MRPLNWVSATLEQENGYGQFSHQMILALQRSGAAIFPHQTQRGHFPNLNTDHLTIAFMPAHILRKVEGKLWAFSMFEASVAPPEFVTPINEFCERLIVPCQQNVEAFQRGGVTVPIHVVPGGVDFAQFPILTNERQGRPYTFLCFADRAERKGVMETYMAFYAEFGDDENVQLLLKARPKMMPNMPSETHDNSRVRFWVQDVGSMAEVYSHADCLVFPSYAEGYGMPPREAAAMGLPVIASRHSGLADHLDCWALPLEKFTERPARTITSLTLSPDAMWWTPDIDEIGAQMRWCYEHQDEARQKGQAAALWLRQNQTWEQSAKALITLMEEYA